MRMECIRLVLRKSISKISRIFFTQNSGKFYNLDRDDFEEHLSFIV